MLSPAGVEENEASRFVDYTCATPWEDICSKIENLLKRFKQPDGLVNEDYKGLSTSFGRSQYILSVLDISSHPASQDPLYSAIEKLLECKRCIIITPENRWAHLSKSTRATTLSAICCGVETSGVHNVPIVLVCKLYPNVEDGPRELVAYEIKEWRGRLFMAFSQYYTLVRITHKNSIYYLDGMVTYLQQKLAQRLKPSANEDNGRNFAFQSSSSSFAINALCTVSEVFRYKHNGSDLSQRTRFPFSPAASYADLSVASDSKVASGDLLKDAKLLILKDLWMEFPAYNSQGPLLTHLTVTLRYNGVRTGSFIDNESYTTLVSSKQPYTAWSVQANFRSIPDFAWRRSSNDGVVVNASSTLGSCLRRLLVFYIHSSARRLLSEIQNDEQVSPALIKRTSKSFATIASVFNTDTFSSRLRVAIDEMTGKNRTRLNYAATPSVGHVAFIKRLLSNETLVASSRTSSLGSWYDHLALWIGDSATDLQSIAEMWGQTLESLRLLWEEGRAIPRLWPLRDETQAQPLSAESPLSSPTNYHLAAAVDRASSSTQQLPEPLWQDSLWSDAVDRILLEQGEYIEVPNQNRSVLEQKLELLQFCSLFRTLDTTVEIASDSGVGEKSMYKKYSSSIPSVRVGGLQRRMPVTDDIIYQTSSQASSSASLSGKKFQVGRSLARSSSGASISLQAVSGKASSTLQGDSDDDIDDIDKVPDAIIGDVETFTKDMLIYWQVLFPAVISDMRAFQAENRTSSCSDFLDWYHNFMVDKAAASSPSAASKSKQQHASGKTLSQFVRETISQFGSSSSPKSKLTLNLSTDGKEKCCRRVLSKMRADPLVCLRMIWDRVDPCVARDQQPLFIAEKEAEKVLACLDDFPLSLLAPALFLSAATCVIAMIEHELSAARENKDGKGVNQVPTVGAQYDNTECVSYFSRKLADIRDSVVEVASLMKTIQGLFDSSDGDSKDGSSSYPSSASAGGVSSLVSLHADCVAKMDSLILSIDELEEFLFRAYELSTVLMLPLAGGLGSRLVTALAEKGNATAQSEEEARALFELVKFISHNHPPQQGGIGVSVAGANNYNANNVASSRSLHSSWDSSDGRELGRPTKKVIEITCADIFIDYTGSGKAGAYVNRDSDEAAPPPALSHRLLAEIDGDKMSVFLRTVEGD